MSIDQIIALVIALGGGVFFREIVLGAWKWLTGRQERERKTLQQVMRDLDSESSYRRRLAEHAAELRRILIENGLSDKLPDFPTREKEIHD